MNVTFGIEDRSSAPFSSPRWGLKTTERQRLSGAVPLVCYKNALMASCRRLLGSGLIRKFSGLLRSSPEKNRRLEIVCPSVQSRPVASRIPVGVHDAARTDARADAPRGHRARIRKEGYSSWMLHTAERS